MRLSKLYLGVVADDFTGASDAASFLAKAGLETFLCNGIQNIEIDKLENANAVVVALKSRSEPADKAVKENLEAFDWLKQIGARQLYFKYCATFDSTEKGNIGPVADALLEKYDIPYTLLCPALISNGRTVRDGILYVNGVPLSETHMKDHPLTPMRDSYIPNLIGMQSAYKGQVVSAQSLKDNIVLPECDEVRYLIPDYYQEEQGELIVKRYGDLPLLTGGSGLCLDLGNMYAEKYGLKSGNNKISSRKEARGRTILVAGSCSKVTLDQIADYQKDHPSYRVKVDNLLNNEETAETVLAWLNGHADGALVYSSQAPEELAETQKLGAEKASRAIERFFAALSELAVKNGYTDIIAAGGETSGAITKALGFQCYRISESVAPGVPMMIPLKNDNITLVLKSGGFGQIDFFRRALAMCKNR